MIDWTETFSLKYHEPGEVYTAVNVYDGGRLIVSRRGKYPDTIKSNNTGGSSNKWSIEVDLPTNRHRVGTLTFYMDGVNMHSCDCLGRGTVNVDRTDTIWKI